MTVSSTGDTRIAVAPLYAYGGAEAVVAEAGLALDEQGERLRDVQRGAQEAQRKSALERIEQMRDASVASLIGGVMEGVATMGTAVLGGLAGAEAGSTADWLAAGSKAMEGAGTAVKAFYGFHATSSEIDAEAAGQRASMHEGQVDDLKDARGSADRLRDKAMAHLDQIAQARMDARLQSVRG